MKVKSGGERNYYERGTLYHFDPSVNYKYIDTRIVGNFLDYPGSSTSNVEWAIGGISLHLTENYASSNEYYNDILGSPEYAENINATGQEYRTAIGYGAQGPTGSNKTICVAVFDKTSLWEVRQFMDDVVDCTYGVCLDGGSSSQIRYYWFYLG